MGLSAMEEYVNAEELMNMFEQNITARYEEVKTYIVANLPEGAEIDPYAQLLKHDKFKHYSYTDCVELCQKLQQDGVISIHAYDDDIRISTPV